MPGSPGSAHMERSPSIHFRYGSDTLPRQFLVKHLPELIALVGGRSPSGAVTAAELDRLSFLIGSVSRSAPFGPVLPPSAMAASVGGFFGIHCTEAPVDRLRAWLATQLVASAQEPVAGVQRLSSPRGVSPSASHPHGASQAAPAGGGEAMSIDVQPGSPAGGTGAVEGAVVHPHGGTEWTARGGIEMVEGLHRTTLVRRESPETGWLDPVSAQSAGGGAPEVRQLRIYGCSDSVMYFLHPVSHVWVGSCTECIVFVGACSRVITVESCERVQIVTATHAIHVSNCHDCSFYLCTNEPPLLFGDNRNLVVAPYNTFYPALGRHLELAGVNPKINKWQEVSFISNTGSHSMTPPGASDASPVSEGGAEGHGPQDASAPPVHALSAPAPSVVATLAPDKFVPFTVPFHTEGSTRGNPCGLPRAYSQALEGKVGQVSSLRGQLRLATLEGAQKRELQATIQAHFKDWLVQTGYMRHVYDLVKLDSSHSPKTPPVLPNAHPSDGARAMSFSTDSGPDMLE